MELEIVKMTSKGQIVVPQEIREVENIKEGERFIVFAKGDSLIFKRIKSVNTEAALRKFEETFEYFHKKFKKSGLTQDDINTEIQAYRREKHGARRSS